MWQEERERREALIIRDSTRGQRTRGWTVAMNSLKSSLDPPPVLRELIVHPKDTLAKETCFKPVFLSDVKVGKATGNRNQLCNFCD